MKEHIWSPREVKNRLACESAGRRVGWGDDIANLLASPIYREPLAEPGAPLFWAPLLRLLAGLRLEEGLQLRTGDFDTEQGIAFPKVQISTGNQRLKTEAAHRNIQTQLRRNLPGTFMIALPRERCSFGMDRPLTAIVAEAWPQVRLGSPVSSRWDCFCPSAIGAAQRRSRSN